LQIERLPTQNTIVAANQVGTQFSIFDFKSNRWTPLISGQFVNWVVSRDGQYLLLTTAGIDPKLQRLSFATRQLETLVSLKAIRRVVDPLEGQTQIGIAPDGSAIFARDIGSQEVYALHMRWP
jgi:hypothetical protein